MTKETNTNKEEVRQVVASEFEFGSYAELLLEFQKKQTSATHRKLVTQFKQFIRSLMILRGNYSPSFDIVSICKVTDFEYPSQVSFVIYYVVEE
jgi:hypothetical protein